MTGSTGIRTISFDRRDEITEAIRTRESFEVGGCQGRMSEAVQFVKRTIGGEGLTSRTYTRYRLAALIPALIFPVIAVAIAIAIMIHILVTWNPDYKIVKRPIAKALRVSYRKKLIVGGSGSLVLTGRETKAVGGRTISTAAKMAAAVSNMAAKIASMVKNNPQGAAIGAVVGVGAVAAAPFTGAGSVLGAATLASSLAGAGGVAAAAAATGAGVGVAVSRAQTKKVERTAYSAGLQKGKAESAVKIEELSRMMAHAADLYAAQARLNELIISLSSVGFAMAACDGPISDEERACVEEYVIGMSKIMLPLDIRKRLNRIAIAPPDFAGAILYLQSFERDIWPPVDGLLEVIGEADGDINQSEKEFLNKWERYKIAALQEESVQ